MDLNNRPIPAPRRQHANSIYSDENHSGIYTRSYASCRSRDFDRNSPHQSNYSTLDQQRAADQLDAAHAAIEIERNQKQVEILAWQKDLEGQMARAQLELETIDLQAKQQKIRAKSEVLENYCLDDREDIAHELENRSRPGYSPRSQFSHQHDSNPSHMRPTPKPRSVSSLPSANNPVQVERLKLVPVDSDQNKQSDMQLLSETLAKALNNQKAPLPEPHVFRGNPLEFPAWKGAFMAYMSQLAIQDEHKIHYLLKYVGNPASDSISSYTLLQTTTAYHDALKILEERFGSTYTISEAFRSKLDSFQRIKPHDASSLRKFSDFLNQCQSAMQSVHELSVLNDPHTNVNLCQKLPYYLANKWKEKIVKHRQNYGNYPQFSDFARLVKHHADIQIHPVVLGMARTPANNQSSSTTPSQKSNRSAENKYQSSSNRNSFFASKPQIPYFCLCCNIEGHSLSRCRDTFAKWDAEKKKLFIIEHKLCWKCLETGHMSTNCPNPCACQVKYCGRKHPTSRHEQIISAPKPVASVRNTTSSKQATTPSNVPGGANQTANSVTQPPQPTNNDIANKSANTQTTSSDRKGLKSNIVPVWLSHPKRPNQEILVYALLDNMSDTTYISNHVADMLSIPHDAVVNLKINTVNSANTDAKQSRVFQSLNVKGYFTDEKIPLSEVYTVPDIPLNTTHIPTKESAAAWNHLHSIAHEIPEYQNCPVGMLIGYDNSHTIMPLKTIAGPNTTDPFAVQTPQGWAIVGSTNLSSDQSVIRYTNMLSSTTDKSAVTFACFSKPINPAHVLDILQQDFRENRTANKQNPLSQEDKMFLSKLQDNISQTDDGFYKMPLPFRSKPNLPNNRSLALKRLNLLKTKLEKNPKQKAEYLDFMSKLIDNGDCELVPHDEYSSGVNYIPHFAVYHKQKLSLRVVFDLSAKFQGVCLNDFLLQGPDLMNRLVGVLHRFRNGQNAVMCDIQRMFHMFKVNESDRDYLRFLWFADDKFDRVIEYRMTVHLFGAKSSPGCANFGLHYLASEQHDPDDKYSVLANKFLQENLYMDDGLLSNDNSPEMIKIINEAVEICKRGNVRLHKFISNSKEILASIPDSEKSDTLKDLDLSNASNPLPVERALGVKWCTESDTFKFAMKSSAKTELVTRRKILSKVASVFDPLGFLSPFVFEGKRILQDVCKGGYNWDDPLSKELIDRWESWESGLAELDKISIPRCLYPANFGTVVRKELHHFCDASQHGYAQCSYLRSTNTDGQVHVTLLAGKSRVLPIDKAVTIPRAELQAAVLSSKLAENLKADLALDRIDSETFWTYSEIVLGYIQNTTSRFHQYVANRIQQIHDLTNTEQWHHIAGNLNPSDIASRGSNISNLVKSTWFNGPAFLWNSDISDMLVNHNYKTDSGDPEVKATSHAIHKTSQLSMSDKLNKFSSLKSATTAIALLQATIRKIHGTPEPSDVEKTQLALHDMIKMTQTELFSDELNLLTRNLNLPKGSKLCKLNPFIDPKGILRVGGRLAQSDLRYDEKHPIILPKSSQLSKLVIDQCHSKVQHQGRAMTLAQVRSCGYHIIGVNKMTASLIYSCVKCRKSRGKLETQQMAPLPKERVTPTPPFTYVGTDCFGPFLVKENRREVKRYGVIFTCLASRAIHLELISDMTTCSFINALRCFIAIRGPIRKLYSDRGTNFIGASNELSKFSKSNNFDWEFNTPYSSHMGGVWERQIRTVRSVLNNILSSNSNRLDSSSLRTVLYEVMGIVNCRPLSALDNDESALLTPNQLLTMKSDVILPPPGEFDKDDTYSRKQWRVVQSLANEFWSKWRNLYISNLQCRPKCTSKIKPLQIGDIVIIKETALSRNQWPVARVTAIHPSKDGLTRKVTVQVGDANKLNSKGKRISDLQSYDRPIHKLVLLYRPVEN